MGYLEVIHSPVKHREGRYPVAVKVTPDDLRRGSITLPGVVALHNTKTRTWNIAPMGKLALVFDPEAIYEHEKYETDYVVRYETVMMESLTIITKTRNDIKNLGGVRNAP